MKTIVYRVPSWDPPKTLGPFSRLVGPLGAGPYTGTVAVTLAAFTSAASGTVTNPDITGTVSVTLAAFTSTASGTATPPAITGTVAVTLANFTSNASGTFFLGIVGSVAVTLANVTPSASGRAGYSRYPASVSGRKLLDQHGNVYLMRTFSSWAIASNLSLSEITTALEGVVSNGFNAITMWIGGTQDWGTGWHQYTNDNGDNYWSGTVWGSSLGTGWASIDHVVQECHRLGLAVNMSFCGGNGTNGCGDDWEARTNTNMYDAGVAIATRYASYPHLVWHVMLDDSQTPASTRGQRVEALFDGINDTEGASLRPVRWMEPQQGSSIDSQGWRGTTQMNCPVNGIYLYTDSSVEHVENGWADVTTVPFGDVEPPYDGSTHYTGNLGQQLRERSIAVFIEGGVYINYGHEDWWPFGANGIFTEGIAWTDVQTHDHTIQQSYIWDLIDTYCADTNWDRHTGFVTTGEGSGDTKAAAGSSGTAALAYFPNNRTIQVDTTIINGTSNVRLRWFDPTDGTYSTIAASEAQQTGRSVTLPSARGDGTRDFVLVVDALNDVTGTVAVTLAPFTSDASGTSTPPSFTGTVAVSLAAFTSSASATSTPPSFTGTVAVTLDNFTSSGTGAFTPAGSGSAAVTLQNFTSAASGTFTAPSITGTVAGTLAGFTSSASGTAVPPPITGTSTQTLAAFTATASGTYAPPAFTGTAAATLANATASAAGVIGQNGTATPTLANATANASGTFIPPPITGTVAVVLGLFIAAASGSGSGVRESVIRRWRVHADDRRLTPIHDRIYRPPNIDERTDRPPAR